MAGNNVFGNRGYSGNERHNEAGQGGSQNNFFGGFWNPFRRMQQQNQGAPNQQGSYAEQHQQMLQQQYQQEQMRQQQTRQQQYQQEQMRKQQMQEQMRQQQMQQQQYQQMQEQMRQQQMQEQMRHQQMQQEQMRQQQMQQEQMRQQQMQQEQMRQQQMQQEQMRQQQMQQQMQQPGAGQQFWKQPSVPPGAGGRVPSPQEMGITFEPIESLFGMPANPAQPPQEQAEQPREQLVQRTEQRQAPQGDAQGFGYFAQNERNSAVFYEYLAGITDDAAKQRELVAIADMCRKNSGVFNRLYRNTNGADYRIKETEIDTSVDFKSGVKWAIREEGTAVKEFADLLQQLGGEHFGTLNAIMTGKMGSITQLVNLLDD